MTDDNIRFKCAHCDFETSKRDVFELVDHVNEKHPDHTFLCGRRGSGLAERLMRGKRDCWEKMPNGDRTCSYCGSLSEDDLIDILTHYANGDEGYRFEPSTKNHKLYANRPGVSNAMQGGIKFYKCHVDENHPDHAKRQAIFERAMARFRDEWRRLTGT